MPTSKTSGPRKPANSATARKPKGQGSGAKRSSILKTARDHFGYEELRPGQEEAIQALLANRDTLTVMPTGSGKSAIYQIDGLMMPGSVLVVSPLITLAKGHMAELIEINAQ